MVLIEEKVAHRVPGETSLRVSFDFNRQIIDIIKGTEAAVWDKTSKTWEVSSDCLAYLIDNISHIDDISLNLIEDSPGEEHLNLTLDYKTKPFSYQLEGIEWLINNRNSILADPPGLGKTLQIIYTAEELKAQKGVEHCLIICGICSIKTNWRAEIEKHSRLSCRIIGEKINSKGNVTWASMKDRCSEISNKLDDFFIIINVECLQDNNFVKAILKSKNSFDMIVFDEVHKAKSPTSLRGSNLLKLPQIAKYCYGLTGTLIVNSPLDVYVPLRFIKKENSIYSAFKAYHTVYDGISHNEFVCYKNIDKLRARVESASLRRPKEILNLPPKNIIAEYVELAPEQRKLYDNMINSVFDDIDKVEMKADNLRAMLVRLRQATSCPSLLTSKSMEEVKISRAIDLAEEIIANGDKVVIFSSFKDPISKLKIALEKYNPLVGTGDMNNATIQESINKFQTDDKYKVFLGTLDKMSTGFTLTAASYMIMIDTKWTWSEFEQACDRIYRIGTNNSVFIYNLIAANTVDERVYKVITTKKDISSYMVDHDSSKLDELKFILGLSSAL